MKAITGIAAVLALVGLGGCTSDGAGKTDPPPTERVVLDPSSEGEPDDGTGARSSNGLLFATWAKIPPMPADEGRIGSAEKDGIRVDAYVPKDGEAPADAVWVDDQTQKPLLKKGAKVAYVVFAATNVGEAPVYVEWAGWSPSVSAEGWDYFTSLGSLVLPEEDGNYSATAIQDALIPEDPNARVKLEPGESCAVTLLVPHGYANYTFAGPLNIYGAEAAAEPERTVVFEGIELGL